MTDTSNKQGNKTQPNQETSTPPFSSDDLRQKAVIHQAEQDAFQDARAYLEHYDNCFNSLREKGVLNLLSHRLKTHQESLIQRQNLTVNNQENIEGKYLELLSLMGKQTPSQSHFLPLS